MLIHKETLDLTRRSDLQWHKEKERCLEAISFGKHLFFTLEFDQIDSLALPTIASQNLALEQLSDWLSPFSDQMAGIELCVLKDKWSSSFKERMIQVRSMLPPVDCYINYQIPNLSDYELLCEMFSRPLGHFKPLLSSSELPVETFCAQGDQLVNRTTDKKPARAVLLLPVEDPSSLQPLFTLCSEKQLWIRVVPAADFIENWDEIDTVFVDHHAIDDHIIRQLQGFQAAEGSVVFLSEPTGLIGEQSLQDYTSHHVAVPK